MRKIVAATFVSLDGVMQAPGGPEEDPTGGFKLGGWTWPYSDAVAGEAIGELFSKPFDLLLGRFAYDIFASYWPYTPLEPSQPGYAEGNAYIAKAFNACTKYVATHRPDSLKWQNTQWLGKDPISGVRELKKKDGPKLLIQGSSELIHQLLKAGLIDELQLQIFPLLIGKGKKLFADDGPSAELKLTKSITSPNGIILARYERTGEVKTGTYATTPPSAAEVERRKQLAGK